MTNINIVILVDDKKMMLDALQEKLIEAGEYRDICVEILVDKWGAKQGQIDLTRLKESVYGYIIGRQRKGLKVACQSDYIKEHLAHLSNIGLERVGLTREQYEAVLDE